MYNPVVLLCIGRKRDPVLALGSSRTAAHGAVVRLRRGDAISSHVITWETEKPAQQQH